MDLCHMFPPDAPLLPVPCGFLLFSASQPARPSPPDSLRLPALPRQLRKQPPHPEMILKPRTLAVAPSTISMCHRDTGAAQASPGKPHETSASLENHLQVKKGGAGMGNTRPMGNTCPASPAHVTHPRRATGRFPQVVVGWPKGLALSESIWPLLVLPAEPPATCLGLAPAPQTPCPPACQALWRGS